MTRAHNFCAGPCVLPVPVLTELRDEFVDFAGSGMSLVELSHRSKLYEGVHLDTLDRLRRVSGAPDDVDVLLVQGGATLQFAMVPMNLLAGGSAAAFALTGSWAKKAFQDAGLVGAAYPAWDGADLRYRRAPRVDELELRPATRYLHLTSNETIGGVRLPDLGAFGEAGVPLVIDASSDYLARPLPWDHADVVYGGVQKNLGPAGLAVVFVRKRVVEAGPELPGYLAYRTHAAADSLANTPSMFAVWATGKVLAWIESIGGTEALEARAAERSGRIYAAVDASDGFYVNPVEPADRSHHNVVFTLREAEREAEFLAGAEERGMTNLKGHRSVGGIRASVYAALPDASVDALVDYLEEFRAGRG